MAGYRRSYKLKNMTETMNILDGRKRVFKKRDTRVSKCACPFLKSQRVEKVSEASLSIGRQRVGVLKKRACRKMPLNIRVQWNAGTACVSECVCVCVCVCAVWAGFGGSPFCGPSVVVFGVGRFASSLCTQATAHQLSAPPPSPPSPLPAAGCLSFYGRGGSFAVRNVVHSRGGGGTGVFKPISATGASTSPWGGIYTALQFRTAILGCYGKCLN